MEPNPDAPVAAWLRASRASQDMDDGAGGTKKWTVAHFLALLEAEEGWAPANSNYSNYELGKQTPTPVTLKKFTNFWARRGIVGPDLTPREEPAPEPTLNDLVKAQIAATDRQTEMLERVLQAIAGPQLDPERQAWARAQLAGTTPSRGPTPDPVGGTAR